MARKQRDSSQPNFRGRNAWGRKLPGLKTHLNPGVKNSQQQQRLSLLGECFLLQEKMSTLYVKKYAK